VADSLYQFAYLTLLEFQLMLVRNMLVIAAPAATEIRTERLDSFHRTSQHVSEFRTIEFVLLLDDLRLDFFAIDRQRHENYFSVRPRNACAAESDVFNLQSGTMMRGRRRSELALWNIGYPLEIYWPKVQ
jgi:hypothetical protein